MTNKTPINPKNKDVKIQKLNLSFKKIIDKMPPNIGANIFNVVNSGKDIFLSEIKVKKGKGARKKLLIKGI